MLATLGDDDGTRVQMYPLTVPIPSENTQTATIAATSPTVRQIQRDAAAQHHDAADDREPPAAHARFQQMADAQAAARDEHFGQRADARRRRNRNRVAARHVDRKGRHDTCLDERGRPEASATRYGRGLFTTSQMSASRRLCRLACLAGSRITAAASKAIRIAWPPNAQRHISPCCASGATMLNVKPIPTAVCEVHSNRSAMLRREPVVVRMISVTAPTVSDR